MDSVGKTEIILFGGNFILTAGLGYYFKVWISDLESQILGLSGKIADTIKLSSQTDEAAANVINRIVALTNDLKAVSARLAENEAKMMKTINFQGKAITELQNFLKVQFGTDDSVIQFKHTNRPKKKAKGKKGKSKRKVPVDDSDSSSHSGSESSNDSTSDDDIAREMNRTKR